jgi:hypothetical protein
LFEVEKIDFLKKLFESENCSNYKKVEIKIKVRKLLKLEKTKLKSFKKKEPNELAAAQVTTRVSGAHSLPHARDK